MALEPDRWSRWLLERRDAGDERQRSAILDRLAPVRERVLAHAEPLDGATLLDVGTGDGLIGLEALDRVGPQGTVIFSDISDALLGHVHAAVSERGLLDRAQFISTRAEDLAEIPAATVDVVTTRSVLIYVTEKALALAAMERVLRPGGRISLFEPINSLMYPEPGDRFWGYDVSAVSDLADKVKASYRGLSEPASAAMLDFDDRDLVELTEAAGFGRIHMECHLDVEAGAHMRAISIEALLDSAPNPLAPTARESIAAALTESEQERFVGHLARAIDAGERLRRSAVAYLVASKPG
ncbi:MAG TPA: class I SAM-dependent methyltransferase [Solirubrobacteraceae bacterium]|nr:class I SAM-dependent methyltransferase [Solirubrobacteraceae bacterium]